MIPFPLKVTSRSSKVSSASRVRQLSVEMRVGGARLEERFSMRGGVSMMDVDLVEADVLLNLFIDVGGDVIADDDGVGKVITRPSAVLRGVTALP
jgi:hypothetical protein